MTPRSEAAMENGTESDNGIDGNGVLARMPRDERIELPKLAQLFGRCEKSIMRAVARDELPIPFKHMGKKCWLAGDVIDKIKACRDNALKRAREHAARLAKHTA